MPPISPNFLKHLGEKQSKFLLFSLWKSITLLYKRFRLHGGLMQFTMMPLPRRRSLNFGRKIFLKN